MKGRNSIKFNIFWNLIIGFIISTVIVTAFISKDKLIELEWVGISLGIGSAYACCKWTKNEIDYLKNEVNKLKEKCQQEKDY